MPNGMGQAYPLIAHGSTVAQTTVPVVSMKMTVPINRRSIQSPHWLLHRGVEGSTTRFYAGVCSSQSRKAMIMIGPKTPTIGSLMNHEAI